MVTAIVQARLGSTRLPGKVLLDIEGKPLLWHVIDRLKKASLVDKIIIATGKSDANKPIIELAAGMDTPCFCGSEDDVLDRYYRAAAIFGGEAIVRVTGDCPLIDPRIVDLVVGRYLEGGCDYAANTLNPTYPDGLDVEVFSFAALEKAWQEARWSSEREHVTPYIRNHPEIFRLAGVEHAIDLSCLRFSVDRPEDLKLVREIFRYLYGGGRIFYMEEILRLLEKYPEMVEINRCVINNEGYKKSLMEDRIVR